MTNENAAAYLRTKVLTASPEELRLLLFDGALRFIRQGRDGLVRKDYEAVFTGFTKCRNIILELMNSVREDLDPVLKSRINGVYTFMYVQLIEASFEKDVAKADKVISLLEYERETWILAMQKAAEERGAVAGKPTVNVETHAADRQPLSLQG
jgi:flagellar secretion chaperone FliS